jgi:hypothetical protein
LGLQQDRELRLKAPLEGFFLEPCIRDRRGRSSRFSVQRHFDQSPSELNRVLKIADLEGIDKSIAA